MAKYEWLDVAKTKLKMKINDDGSMWKEVSSQDGNYLYWASQEENVADTPDWITTVIALEAESVSE